MCAVARELAAMLIKIDHLVLTPQLVSMWGHRVQESVVFRCWTEDGNEDEDEGDDSDG